MKFKSLKKVLLASLTLTLLLGVGATASAGYKLSDEVTTATPALLAATEIGLKTNENPALAALPNKDAILVMSFGTTFTDTRAKTIDATVNAIKANHPGVKVVTAFTSHIIIDRIKAKEGLKKANAIYERHTVLTQFIHKILKVDLEIAEKDACRIEHIISDETFKGIKKLLK